MQLVYHQLTVSYYMNVNFLIICKIDHTKKTWFVTKRLVFKVFLVLSYLLLSDKYGTKIKIHTNFYLCLRF